MKNKPKFYKETEDESFFIFFRSVTFSICTLFLGFIFFHERLFWGKNNHNRKSLLKCLENGNFQARKSFTGHSYIDLPEEVEIVIFNKRGTFALFYKNRCILTDLNLCYESKILNRKIRAKIAEILNYEKI